MTTLVSHERHPCESEPLTSSTVPEYMLQRAKYFAETHGDKPMIIDAHTGEEVHFKDFDRLSANVASWFHSQGMQKGDVVLSMVNQAPKIPIFMTGVWRANGAIRTSYAPEPEDLIRERVIESKIKWIYCDASDLEKAKRIGAQVPWKLTYITDEATEDSEGFEAMLRSEGAAPSLEVTPDDVCITLLTSGSTGKPKGVWRDHRSWLACVIGVGRSFVPDAPESALLGTSPVHLSGACLSLTMIAVGAATIIPFDSSAEKCMEGIQKYKAQYWMTLPARLNDVLSHPDRAKYDLTSLRGLPIGGAKVTKELYEQIKLELTSNICLVYGCTEDFTFCGVQRTLEDGKYVACERKNMESSVVMPGSKIQIRDLDTDQVLGPNKIGEICGRSPGSFCGYVNEPEKTAAAFTSDGLVRTGDSGFIDEDGGLTIVGRIKELFKFRGNHISPDDIDTVVSAHPAVKECVTFGIDFNNLGDVTPRVLVVLRPGAFATPDDLLDFANEKLTDYQRIRGGLYLVPELPRTSTGKISRQLAAQVQVAAP